MPKASSWQGSWQRRSIFYLVTALVIAADQLSKLWVRSSLSIGELLPEEGRFQLTYVANKGAVFGFSVPWVLPVIFSVLVIVAACFLYYKYPLFHGLLAKIALGLIFGGATGNLIDRAHLGYVVDFIYIRLWRDYHWPAFNLADTAIVVGAILLAYFLIYSMKPLKHS